MLNELGYITVMSESLKCDGTIFLQKNFVTRTIIVIKAILSKVTYMFNELDKL